MLHKFQNKLIHWSIDGKLLCYIRLVGASSAGSYLANVWGSTLAQSGLFLLPILVKDFVAFLSCETYSIFSLTLLLFLRVFHWRDNGILRRLHYHRLLTNPLGCHAHSSGILLQLEAESIGGFLVQASIEASDLTMCCP